MPLVIPFQLHHWIWQLRIQIIWLLKPSPTRFILTRAYHHFPYTWEFWGSKLYHPTRGTLLRRKQHQSKQFIYARWPSLCILLCNIQSTTFFKYSPRCSLSIRLQYKPYDMHTVVFCFACPGYIIVCGRSLEAARLDVWIIRHQAQLPRSLSSFRANGKVWIRISWLRDFAIDILR